MSLSDWKPMERSASRAFTPLFLKQGEKEFLMLGEVPTEEPVDPREEARRIILEAQQRADLIQREAFEKGFFQGEKAGREMAERAMEKTIVALERAVAQWDMILQDREGELVFEVVSLAMAVAKKILQKEVSLDPRVVLQVVKAALSKARVREDVVIRVNPMDLETILEARGDLLRELEEVRSIRVEADEGVERGGALVECSMGELDLRLERQFREIEQAFQRLLEEEKRVVQPEKEQPEGQAS